MKHISIVIPEADPNLSSIVGTYKIFSRAIDHMRQIGKKHSFKIQLVGQSKTIAVHDGLFSVHPHATFKDIKKTDLIIIPAIKTNFAESLEANKAMYPWVAKQYAAGAEVASMCTGAFLLAKTGLLNGKNCATHWIAANAFVNLFPEVHLVSEDFITDEHRIYTNGGAFSFLNLVLYLVEKFCGRETAIFCSKVFQIDFDRQSQSPFAIFSGLKSHQDKEIKSAQLFLEKHVGEKISVQDLADKFAIGRRNFDRRFIKATGNTPIEYAQKVKMESAKKAFESTRKTINEVMYEVGYSDVKAFREVFRKITGLTPMAYKDKYNQVHHSQKLSGTYLTKSL